MKLKIVVLAACIAMAWSPALVNDALGGNRPGGTKPACQGDKGRTLTGDFDKIRGLHSPYARCVGANCGYANLTEYVEKRGGCYIEYKRDDASGPFSSAPRIVFRAIKTDYHTINPKVVEMVGALRGTVIDGVRWGDVGFFEKGWKEPRKLLNSLVNAGFLPKSGEHYERGLLCSRASVAARPPLACCSEARLKLVRTDFEDCKVQAALKVAKEKEMKVERQELEKKKILAEAAAAEKERVQAEKAQASQQCVKKKSVEKCLDLLVPPDQLEFNLVVSTGREVYEKANNELKKTQVRLRRKGFLSSLSIRVSKMKYPFSNWTGEVIKMGTTGDQMGWLYIRPLGIDDVLLGTYNNDLSDTGLGTLIKPGSYVFNQLTELSTKALFSAGSTIYFSGAFYIPGKLNTLLFGDFASVGDEEDFFEETSLTENGAMTDPQFIVKFTCVKKVADGPC